MLVLPREYQAFLEEPCCRVFRWTSSFINSPRRLCATKFGDKWSNNLCINLSLSGRSNNPCIDLGTDGENEPAICYGWGRVFKNSCFLGRGKISKNFIIPGSICKLQLKGIYKRATNSVRMLTILFSLSDLFYFCSIICWPSSKGFISHLSNNGCHESFLRVVLSTIKRLLSTVCDPSASLPNSGQDCR